MKKRMRRAACEELLLGLLKMRLVEVDTSLIDPNPIQPEDRTRDAALLSLKEKIKATRIILPPVIQINPAKSGRYTEIDGGRRSLLAKGFAISRLDCIVLPASAGDPRVLFCQLNAATRAFKGQTWMQVWAKDPCKAERDKVLHQMPKAAAARTRALIKILSEEELRAVALRVPFSPVSVNHIELLGQLLRDEKIPYDKKAMAVWVLTTGAQAAIKKVDGQGGRERQRNLQRMAEAMREGHKFVMRRRTTIKEVAA